VQDLKLSNILLSLDGSVKLTDFGMSTELADSLAVARSFKGTATHMAPERVKHGTYSFSSDIWSFGICMLECATGHSPYEGYDTYIGTCDAIVANPPPRAKGLRGACSRELSELFDEFVGQCLRKNPAERLSADTLLESKWIASHGITSLGGARERLGGWIEVVKSSGVEAANAAAMAAADAMASASSTPSSTTTEPSEFSASASSSSAAH
jgi:serine/threonine protein kinase